MWGTIKYVRHHSYAPFVIYRVALGVLVLAIYWRAAPDGSGFTVHPADRR